jgi:ABC-type nitrate/sulfonate/bicarbonate transport system substrate-binding protein
LAPVRWSRIDDAAAIDKLRVDRLCRVSESATNPKTFAAAARGTTPNLRVGFVPLLDAAPLIAARERGFFSAEGLDVTLERQLGWGNVRAKLVYGQLHASHALLGMPPASVLEAESPERLVSVMSLGMGGNGITLSRSLADAGIDSPVALARHIKSRRSNRPFLMAHVFGCSTHHYFVRDWLTTGGIDSDRDLQLAVLPPPQMAAQLRRNYLDGFCAGEPWNTLAERERTGRVVTWTTSLTPHHPEKVLAVGAAWLAANSPAVEALIRAVLQGCIYCSAPDNAATVAAMLSQPQYLDAPAESLLSTLRPERRAVWSCDPRWTHPDPAHVVWLLEMMRRHGHLPIGADVESIARRSVDSAHYYRAAAALNLPIAKSSPLVSKEQK